MGDRIALINGGSSASGGTWCDYSAMTIEDCVFEDNEVIHDSAWRPASVNPSAAPWPSCRGASPCG